MELLVHVQKGQAASAVGSPSFCSHTKRTNKHWLQRAGFFFLLFLLLVHFFLFLVTTVESKTSFYADVFFIGETTICQTTQSPF